MLSRRSLILGGAGVAATGVAGAGVHQGVLPGRPFLQELLGLNGDAGVIPDVEPGPVDEGHFISQARGGERTGWSLMHPPRRADPLHLVVALHPLGGDHATLTGPEFGLDRFLAAHVRRGGRPFAIAAVDGGRSYWHPRPDGEDAGAMVVDELLPLLAARGVDTSTIGFLGWSMNGYGALRLAALLGPSKVSAVVAVSPAIWSDPEDASATGFDDADEYERYSVLGHQSDLAGIRVRVDCGTGDPFYREVEDYVSEFPSKVKLTSTFEPGGHNPAYWRRKVPEQLGFLGRYLAPE